MGGGGNSEIYADLNVVCPMGGNCKIEGPGRGKCPHCRFRKCLDLGMSLTRKCTKEPLIVYLFDYGEVFAYHSFLSDYFSRVHFHEKAMVICLTYMI